MKDRKYQDVIKKKSQTNINRQTRGQKNEERDKDYKIKVSKHKTCCQNQETNQALRNGNQILLHVWQPPMVRNLSRL
jgi:hypothetical protein